MSVLILGLLFQSSVLSSVDIRRVENSAKQNSAGDFVRTSKAEIERVRRRPSSAQAPLTPRLASDVDEDSVVHEQTTMGANFIRDGLKPNLKILAAEPYPGCRKTSRSPMGVKLKGSNVTDGLTDVYKCPGYSALVTYTDVAAPIDGSVTLGFPEAEIDAVINGGAVSRSFYAVPGKGGRVTNMWIGKRDAMTVSLISNTLSLKEMQLRADLMTETLTKSL